MTSFSLVLGRQLFGELAASIVMSTLKVEAACFSAPLLTTSRLCYVITQKTMEMSNDVFC
jgi:hypothetical protein